MMIKVTQVVLMQKIRNQEEMMKDLKVKTEKTKKVVAKRKILKILLLLIHPKRTQK